MRQLFRFVTSFYLILGALVGVTADARGLVLCMAPSGHLAIESGFSRCTDGSPTASSVVAYAPGGMLAGACGSCTDVPVGSPQVSNAQDRTRPGSSSLGWFPAPTAFAVVPALGALARKALRRGAPDERLLPVAARTTILRI